MAKIIDKNPESGEGNNQTPEINENATENKEQALLARIAELENALVVAVKEPRKIEDRPIEGKVYNLILREGQTYKPSGSKKTYTLNTVVQSSDFQEIQRAWKSGRFKVIPVS